MHEVIALLDDCAPPAAAQFDWKTLIPLARLNKVRSAWLKKFRDHQFERWLTSK
jgi:hypothetical protein